MPSITHAHIRDLDSPGRFADALIVDCRYQRHASWTPAVVAPLFPGGRYLHVPALGSQACTNGEGEATPQVIAWSEGLHAVQAAHTPGQAVIVLCGCAELDGRSHRQLVAKQLAHALGLTEAGPLRFLTS